MAWCDRDRTVSDDEIQQDRDNAKKGPSGGLNGEEKITISFKFPQTAGELTL